MGRNTFLINSKSATAAILFFLMMQMPALAFDAPADSERISPGQNEEITNKYTELTKKILLSGIELERFSLNYRLRNCKLHQTARVVFIGTQETAAATLLAFEAAGDKEFGRARHHLLSFRERPLKRGARAAEVGAIIGASGALYELGLNMWRYEKNRKLGFDSGSADRYVSSKLKDIDKLLSERQSLVSANPQHPLYARALIEGKILSLMRDAFLNEYSNFSINTRSAFVVKNLFFLLNAAYNITGATAAGYGYAALKKPKLNGTANIMFAVSGALAGATPLLCSTERLIHRKLIKRAHEKSYGVVATKSSELTEQLSLLKESMGGAEKISPSSSVTQRLAIYADASKSFSSQLLSELTMKDRLDRIALETSVLGPPIGGLLMTQGILGTAGYYKYFPLKAKKDFDLNYKGTVCGTTAASISLVGNAAWLLASLSYDHYLKKKQLLPEQLIKGRLERLVELEKMLEKI